MCGRPVLAGRDSDGRRVFVDPEPVSADTPAAVTSLHGVVADVETVVAARIVQAAKAGYPIPKYGDAQWVVENTHVFYTPHRDSCGVAGRSGVGSLLGGFTLASGLAGFLVV